MSDIIEIFLEPNIGKVPPRLKVSVASVIIFEGIVNKKMTLKYETELSRRLVINIEKSGKTKKVVDSREPQEVLISCVLLNGFDQHPDKFGIFEQKNNPYVKDRSLQGNEMALNGTWALDVPVFGQKFIPELERMQRDSFENTQIACFGCSFTYGSYLDDDQTWPHYLGGDVKNYGVGGNSISAIVGTAHWYVSNFRCDKLIMLLPHVCRLQFHDQQKGLWTFIPFQGDERNGPSPRKKIIEDIVMFGEPSLIFSGYARRMKELLGEINKKTDLYLSSYDMDTYNMVKKILPDDCKILPFYELSDKFDMASDKKHPGPEHNKIFANQIKPIIRRSKDNIV